MAECGETRDRVLTEEDLRAFLLELTAAEFRARIYRRYSFPPLVSIAGCFGVAVILLLGDVGSGALLFFALFALQGIWAAIAIWRRSVLRIEDTCETIRSGHPPESVRQLIVSRVQWWTHLIVPSLWGPNSRLLSQNQIIETHLKDLENRYRRNQLATFAAENPPPPPSLPRPGAEPLPPPEPEPEPELPPMPIGDLGEVMPQIRELDSRLAYEMTLGEIADPQERLCKEYNLYLGLQTLVQEMIERLKRIDRLGHSIRNLGNADLATFINQAIPILRERRQLVLDVDNLRPEEFRALVVVHEDAENIPEPE